MPQSVAEAEPHPEAGPLPNPPNSPQGLAFFSVPIPGHFDMYNFLDAVVAFLPSPGTGAMSSAGTYFTIVAPVFSNYIFTPWTDRPQYVPPPDFTPSQIDDMSDPRFFTIPT